MEWALLRGQWSRTGHFFVLPAVLRYTLYFWYSVTELHIWTLYLGYRVYLGYRRMGRAGNECP
ncbi:Uncharacterised protein [Mycobacteroides abscessus]|nr:Uncharacterised protein [Mycobacteroides abscessus]